MADLPTPYLPNDLTDHVALVTGTISGLGRLFASVQPVCGAKVALVGRRAIPANELAKKIHAYRFGTSVPYLATVGVRNRCLYQNRRWPRIAVAI